MTDPDDRTIRDAIHERLAARREGATICPSEAARALASGDAWRALMPRVREVADAEAAAGRLVVTQRGRTVRAREVRGPIRLGPPG